MIVYFSGTGNSRFAAEYLAKKLQVDVLDAGKQIKTGENGDFSSQSMLVFAAPIYGWRIPRVFDNYIRNAQFSENQDIYFVLTCGDDIGNAGAYVEKLCLEKGLNCRGVLEVVMPENYIAMFNTPDWDDASEIVRRALPVLDLGASCIAEDKPFPTGKHHLGDRLKSGLVNDLFYKLFVKADLFYAKENCVSCGKCADVCPLNNIRLHDNRPVWGINCTHCMACICGCPVEAIEYGKKSMGKPRYQCPEI